MKGFFNLTPTKVRTTSTISKCGACGLHTSCQSPKMEFSGEGKKSVLVIAEAPGKNEDREGTQLIGDAGNLFRGILEDFGVDLDEDCWKTNALRCYPGKKESLDDKRIIACRPDVLKTIWKTNPQTIILLGGKAIKSLIGHLWREDVGSVERWVGWKIPCQELNAWICPTYHPSYLLRTKDPALRVWLRRHLKAAFELEGRPWMSYGVAHDSNGPDFESEVELVHGPVKASKIIRKMIEKGGPFAFDYETDRLKPDHPDARIVSCSVCWQGKRTIAFPWEGEVVEAMRGLLAGLELKIGWNIKFEERWTRKVFGHGVTNWWWDGMQAAHVLDNRSGITSLKFQSFVQLGQRSYDDHIAPLLHSTDESGKNKIDQIDLDELLLYNGMDALLTYKIGMKQREEMGLT